MNEIYFAACVSINRQKQYDDQVYSDAGIVNDEKKIVNEDF